MYQTNKPRLKIPLTKLDWLMEFLCLGLLLFNWGYAVSYYGHLPETIPTHFNFSGSVDAYGNKGTVFVLPIIEVFLYLLLTIIGQHPNIHNYLTKITEQNAVPLYTASSRMLRYLKFFSCLMLSCILIQVVHSAIQSPLNLFAFILPIFLVGTITITISFLVRTKQYKADLR